MTTQLTPRTVVHEGQWRLDRVELVNWGTFHGHHVLDVARQGFLLTGHSGSGKSSLVDAIAAVLTARGKLRFNAAAADSSAGRQDRTVASYVRGAWRRQSDASTGEVVSEFLRQDATWSGISLRFSAGPTAPPLTLVKLFHMRRGAVATTDVAEIQIMTNEAMGLLDLEEFARDGLEMRRITKQWPGASVTNKHSTFAARFSRALGIRGDNALDLLHKTQSAKNLGSLDDLFRGFMLDEPKTFRIAETAVEQFSELSQAHAMVVEARNQVDHLSTLDAPIIDYDKHNAAAAHAEALQTALVPFADTWKLELARTERDQTEQTVRTAEHELAVAEQAVTEANGVLARATLLVEERGGRALEMQRTALDRAQETLWRVKRERSALETDLGEVQIAAPESFAEYEELRLTARREREALEAGKVEGDQQITRLHEERAAVITRKKSIEADLAALKRGHSNLDARLVAARDLICRQTRLKAESLPFAGELMAVRPEHRVWTGALERALRPLATVLLVPAAHREVVTRAVDGAHLGARLVIEIVPVSVEPARPLRSDRSLVDRIEVRDGPMTAWLNSSLTRVYDYECVDDVSELHATERGVTLAGQVKRGPNRYEKDDRSRVDDRRHWVLGFDNQDKVEHLLTLLTEVRSEEAAADKQLGDAARARSAAQDRVNALKIVDQREWDELDVVAAQGTVDRAQKSLDELLAASADLRAAEQEQRKAQELVQHTRADETRARDALSAARTALRTLEDVIRGLEQTERPDVSAPHQADLEKRFYRVQRGITHSAVDKVTVQVTKSLSAEREAAITTASAAERRIVEIQSEFKRTWPAITGDLTPDVDDRLGFVAVLDRLRSDRLPEFETKFFDLLENQTQRNIGQLANEIRRAPGEIRDKILPVNDSLKRSEFDAGRFLQIRVTENRTTAVSEFLADLNTISSGSWGQTSREDAEGRFAVMARVMARLSSSESGDRSWQALCLDTRRHVRFTGIEVDQNGDQVNIHDSSAGLSGGQRQKLVIFCLAAALRYQLTPVDQDVPSYGTVILDEAFDKADTDFATMAMDIFLEFGFHMFLATPLKLLQTLEDYVGGIGLTTCRDFRDSTVGLVSIHDEQLREAVEADPVTETAHARASDAAPDIGPELSEGFDQLSEEVFG